MDSYKYREDVVIRLVRARDAAKKVTTQLEKAIAMAEGARMEYSVVDPKELCLEIEAGAATAAATAILAMTVSTGIIEETPICQP